MCFKTQSTKKEITQQEITPLQYNKKIANNNKNLMIFMYFYSYMTPEIFSSSATFASSSYNSSNQI